MILDSTFLKDIEFHDVIGSTNDRALELSGQHHIKIPFLVLAEKSTASRGRENRKWYSPKGAVNLSLIIDADEYGFSMKRNPVISLLVALSVAETVEPLVGDNATHLKWPNDVYVADKKISGILIEQSAQSLNRPVIGIGINVNNSFHSTSPELKEKATSIVDSTGEHSALFSVIMELLRRIAENLRAYEQGHLELVSSWQRYCYLTDKSISISSGARTISGFCRGIDSSGAIIIQPDDGETLHIHSGTINSIL